jgi:glycosyltransferase involved in cell wall biosynthesis
LPSPGLTLVEIGELKSGDQPSVSAVIPTFNRVESLCRVLPSYLRSPVGPRSSAISEVIVVDDAGTDGTEERVGRWMADEPRLRYSRNRENLGVPATRNRGALLARGNWVLQAEDDLALGQGYVETLLRYGVYRTAWLLAVELVRTWRARKYGAFSWE